MYNDEFLQHIIHTYGVKYATVFCEIESQKYDKTIEAKVFTDPIDKLELEYERNWWKERAERLKNDQPC
jgi:hypothetical protein